MSELLIVIEGSLAGRIRADKSGRLSLNYESAWRDSPQGYALSVSMPLAQIIYPHKAVWPYLWNLLPENPNVLQRWGQQYHVSSNNPFKLLAQVGADIAGAAQLIPPERLEEIQSADHPTIEWMSIDELAERLRQLRADGAAVRRPGDIGKMSLPGAQVKTAYYWDQQADRWGVPGGRTPTTHIIKPCIPGFDGLVENEHLCQEVAARLGMSAARSSVLALDQTYIVVERYDRLPPLPGSQFTQRIHQEDTCQALSLMPTKKYQEDGGPSIAQIVTLIRRVSAEPEVDVERFPMKSRPCATRPSLMDCPRKPLHRLPASSSDMRMSASRLLQRSGQKESHIPQEPGAVNGSFEPSDRATAHERAFARRSSTMPPGNGLVVATQGQ